MENKETIKLSANKRGIAISIPNKKIIEGTAIILKPIPIEDCKQAPRKIEMNDTVRSISSAYQFYNHWTPKKSS